MKNPYKVFNIDLDTPQTEINDLVHAVLCAQAARIQEFENEKEQTEHLIQERQGSAGKTCNLSEKNTIHRAIEGLVIRRNDFNAHIRKAQREYNELQRAAEVLKDPDRRKVCGQLPQQNNVLRLLNLCRELIAMGQARIGRIVQIPVLLRVLHTFEPGGPPAGIDQTSRHQLPPRETIADSGNTLSTGLNPEPQHRLMKPVTAKPQTQIRHRGSQSRRQN